MNVILQTILDWSELWGTAIPMIVYLVYEPDFIWIPPIVQYLLVAFLLYFAIDIIMFGNQVKIENDNNWMYNVQAIIRVFFFTRYFELISPKPTPIRKIVLLIFAVAVIVIFTLFDKFSAFSSKLVTLESVAVLFFAVRYFNNLYLLKKDSLQLTRPVLIISSAILFYYATTVIIGVVYDYLVHAEKDLSISIWDIHNLIYIFTMLLFASALKTKTNTQRVQHS